MKNNMIRIAVFGDQKVGKTSLICAIISDLSSQIPKVHKKVVLPPDMCAYSKDIFTEIVDTGQNSDIQTQIKLSDLILLVYDVSQPETIVRLKEHWLPIINQINKQIPIVIVGNKIDLLELLMDEKQEHTPVKQVLRNLVKSYKQVQMGIQCSAYYDKKVKSVLNSAQRAVLYPLGPLYDLSNKQITQKFRKALRRIFRILDKDMAGSLSDADLIELQQRVFQTELSSADIRAIKNIIQKQCKQEQSNYISQEGFIAFQKKCIQMLKIQICWSILRHFDYNNQLEIRAFEDQFVINYANGQSLELSSNVLDFLHRAYGFAQKIQPKNPMKRLFQPSPSIFLQQFLEENLSLQRFILLWHLFTFVNYKQCYRALLYIGYDRKLEECFCLSRGKKKYSDLLKLKQHKIYSIIFIDDGKQYAQFTNKIFQNCIEDGVLTRAVQLYSSQKISKVLILYRVKSNALNHNQFLQIINKIDLIAYFQSEGLDLLNLNKFPSYVMIKKITKEQAQNSIKIFELPEMDLKSFPIKIKQYPSDRLIQYLVNIFSNIQQGFKPEFIQELKRQSQKFKKILIGVASTVATTFALGFFYYTKKNR